MLIDDSFAIFSQNFIIYISHSKVFLLKTIKLGWGEGTGWVPQAGSMELQPGQLCKES